MAVPRAPAMTRDPPCHVFAPPRTVLTLSPLSPLSPPKIAYPSDLPLPPRSLARRTLLTRAFALSWLLCDLATHPEDQAWLRDELRSAADPPKSPALLACVKESMRLNPSAGLGVLRYAGADIPVPGSTPAARIPKGACVGFPIFTIQRPSTLSEPDEFKPRRWLGAEAAAAAEATLPFSTGPRSCVGQAFATTEVHAVAAALVARYEFHMHTPPRAVTALTRKPLGARLLVRRVG